MVTALEFRSEAKGVSTFESPDAKTLQTSAASFINMLNLSGHGEAQSCIKTHALQAMLLPNHTKSFASEISAKSWVDKTM